VIEATGLSRSFDGRPAVEGLTFRLPAGSLLALLGPNGAGKTTTIRLLLGLIRPTAGSATVAGFTVPAADGEGQRLRAACGFLTEAPGFYERRSALDNLRFFARLYGVRQPQARLQAHLRDFGLWDHRDKPVGAFSKGMKQRLALIRALFHDPGVLFLDEPTAGLDPESALEVRERIARLKSEGRTIVVCTHNLQEAERLADWVGILRRNLLAFDALSAFRRGGKDGTTVRIRLAAPAAPWCAAAQACTGVGTVAAEADCLRVTVGEPRSAVPRVVAALAASGAPILEVETESASLEAVYLACIRGRE
jgi:ABC-2 type transport system ATP-binding protein